jgi:DNA modification methylase
VFREVRRVLRDDGTLWLNLGDSYAAQGGTRTYGSSDSGVGRGEGVAGNRKPPAGLKPKDLIGVPWRVAFALQADGWWLRSDIIWHKPNPMPSSVADRCTSSHEYVFMLSKSARYFFDGDAVREEPKPWNAGRLSAPSAHESHTGTDVGYVQRRTQYAEVKGANRRDVWTIGTEAYSDAHFATFPRELPAICVRAGTSEAGCCSACGASRVRVRTAAEGGTIGKGDWNKHDGAQDVRRGKRHAMRGDHAEIPYSPPLTIGFEPSCACDAPTVPSVVLDPFMGSGTTAEVAESLGRRWTGYELNPAYHALIAARTQQQGLFVKEQRPC